MFWSHFLFCAYPLTRRFNVFAIGLCVVFPRVCDQLFCIRHPIFPTTNSTTTHTMIVLEAYFLQQRIFPF
uniref:Uncharacterized protein n=1 Tax=Trichobilharzia regenti TaxID=157069 RepID=A0AA85JK72_TRIRE|nr:unnamed protein product [Trichobilharzia regenti]